jgi:hypothetical protein
MMTEAEWILSDDAKAMYACLREQFGVTRRKTGKRKLKLYGCASCRLFGEALSDPRSIAAVEYMEQLADGEADLAQMETVKEEARQAISDADRRALAARIPHDEFPERLAAEAAFALVGIRSESGAYAHWVMRSAVGASFADKHRRWLDQLRALACLLRDIFGNPFREVAFGKKWRTDTVLTLAKQMYESRDFGAMPILADALQDAGCDNEDILNHCRDANQIHARGCWVVDLVLGKA